MKLFEDGTVHVSENGKCEDFEIGEHIGYETNK